jgi:hypothetical protein
MKTFINKFSSSIIIAFLGIVILFGTTNSQETKFRDQSWRYGITGAVQYNSVSLGWQDLHPPDFNFHSAEDDIDYVDGTGWGMYGGLFGAYLSDSWWGIQLRICYDERAALVEDITKDPIQSFDTKMSYLSFAPSFRIDQHIIPNLYFHAGVSINVALKGTYIYKPDIDKPETEPETDVTRVNAASYGLQAGFGYDFKIATIDEFNSVILSPIFDFSWLVNQRNGDNDPNLPPQNSIEDIWSTRSYRIGFKLAIDYNPAGGKNVASNVGGYFEKKEEIVTIDLPYDNTIQTKNVKGYFPVHPFVYFDKGSKEIPVRYTLLTKSEAKNFKEADLEDFMKGELTTKETNVNQLMKTYYNMLNIYGDRMRKNSGVNLTLRGSDPEEKNGEAMALAVKKYLVDNFEIDPDRISIIVDPPYEPSGSVNTEASSKNLIDDENRKVKFIFSDPAMTKPVKYTIRDESSIDNDLIFTIDNKVAFRSWDVTITGEGKTMYFGPFAYNYERINPAELMRFLESGKYNAKVVITDNKGMKTEENYPFKLTKDTELKNASRYLMLFEYGESGAVSTYEKTIRTEIVPGIQIGNKVMIHGHTDIIGTEAGNKKLSKERADKAKEIMDDQLKKENKNVNVKAIGLGQNKTQYTFDNRYPEGRLYNRNVFVEVIE